jgi:fumarate reductase flavoprotein subunit
MKQLEANIVVIGGGGGGMAAALTAIGKGATGVIVLEKRFTIGGNSSMAGGMIFAAESHLQKEAGVNISRDAVFKETMAFHHYDRVNPRILRAFIDKSADTIKWIEDKGVAYQSSMGSHEPKPGPNPPGSFGRVMKLLAEKFKAGGGQILGHTSARRIRRDSNGRISGVVAINKEGDELQINTKSVILATGGFTGNKELLKKYFPFYYDDVYWTDALPLDGDGIQLAEEAGAYLEDYCTLIRETGYSFKTGKTAPNRAGMEPSTIWVNKKGERFVDETTGHNNASTNALLAQPGKIGFALFDDKLIQIIIDRPSPMGAGPGATVNLREYFQSEDKKGEWVKIGTWDGIADWIGAEAKVLKATVEEYNSFCDKGHDGLFAKDKQYLVPLREPPFYALKFRPLMIDTVGPVRINEHMEVLDKQDKPIPGFYAAGVITSGWVGYDYHLFGSALGYSLNSGRIAGENAVKYILDRRKYQNG